MKAGVMADCPAQLSAPRRRICAKSLILLEARSGVEPDWTDLQSLGALPAQHALIGERQARRPLEAPDSRVFWQKVPHTCRRQVRLQRPQTPSPPNFWDGHQ